jgi:hypothetical protein
MDRADFPMVDVIKLKPLDGHKLWARFSTGEEGVRDYSEMISEGGPVVVPLSDQAFFARVLIEMGVPTWPNGLMSIPSISTWNSVTQNRFRMRQRNDA